jgi:hypothetical protein
MDQSKQPNFRRLAIFMGLFLLLSISLLFWARDVVRELVVVPLSYIVWLFGILVDYTPQLFFWIALLFIAFRIAFTSLSRKRKRNPPASRAAFDMSESPVTRGRISFWVTRVDFLQSRQGEYFSHAFHSSLGKMLLDLLAYRYRLSTSQVEEWLKEGLLDLPADVRAYALESLRPLEGTQAGFLVDLRDWMVNLLQGGIYRLQTTLHRMVGSTNQGKSGWAGHADPRLTQENPRVRRILQFMEEELEVLNDDNGL